jgi:excisionase family DNA binding protein
MLLACATVTVQLLVLYPSIYWLVCIYILHKILGQLSSHTYPVSPAASVGRLFIPVYNLFWTFYWPSELTNFIKKQCLVKILPGPLIRAFIFLSLLLSKISIPIGLTCLFSITMYIASIISQHIEKLYAKYPKGIPAVVLEDYENFHDKKLSFEEKKIEEKLYTPNEVSEILRVPTNKVREWLRTGKLNGVKIGRVWQVRERDLKAFLEQRKE